MKVEFNVVIVYYFTKFNQMVKSAEYFEGEMSLVSIVVPLYNEESNVKEFYTRTHSVFDNLEHECEMIFVDDGSRDQTFSMLKELAAGDSAVKVVSFSRNFGHQAAFTAGLDFTRGSAVVLIDGDLQDPPELIADMIELWKQGADVVYAQRRKRKGENIFKRVTASLFYRIFRYFTDTQIPLDTGDFRLMDRKVVNSLLRLKENNRFMRGLVSWVGFKQVPLYYDRDERFSGETKYPFGKMLRFALNAIVSFSDKPLKIATILGLFSSFVGLAMILWGLYAHFFQPQTTIKGWTSVFISVLFLGGVQLFTLGIIGEYISRIYDESKDRPIYIVGETVNIESDSSLEK